MKSIHFCTTGLIELLNKKTENSEVFVVSYRTGWIRNYKVAEIIIVKIRNKEGIDKPFCRAIIREYKPIQYKNIPKTKIVIEEILRYNRKFHPDDWFFKIVLELI